MWRKADLHRHTTPNETDPGEFDAAVFVRACLRDGLNLVAVTDHGHVDSVEPVAAAADGTGLEVIPGIEVSTDRGHIIVLCPGGDGVLILREFAARTGIRPGVDVSFDELVRVAETQSRADGSRFNEYLILISAHADSDGSLLGARQPASVDNQLDAARHLHAIEVVRPAVLAEWQAGGVKQRADTNFTFIRGSDAHGEFGYEPRFTWLYLPALTSEALMHCLATPEASVCLGEAHPEEPTVWISQLSVEGGPFNGLTLDFCPRGNAIIGPPSSGKSFAIDAIRWTLGDEPAVPEVLRTAGLRLDHCLPSGASVAVRFRSGGSELEIRRTRGGQGRVTKPFSFVAFSQNELSRRAMETVPSTSLLDLHCPRAAELKRTSLEKSAELPPAFRSALEKAARARSLRTEVHNEHDGLSATKAELDALTGTEEVAKAARDLHAIEEWSQTAGARTAQWEADFRPPAGPLFPEQPEIEIKIEESERALLLPNVQELVTNFGEVISAAVRSLADETKRLLLRSHEQAQLLESQLGIDTSEAEMVTGRLGALRARLSLLNEKNRELAKIEAELDEELDALDRNLDALDALRLDLRVARQDTCSRVNESMRSFVVKLRMDDDAAALDAILDDLKVGTWARTEDIRAVRNGLDRKRLLRLAVRHTQGWKSVDRPDGHGPEMRQDIMSRAALERGKVEQLAMVGGIFVEDGIELMMKERGGQPRPFQELTEGLRALAIKEISFAAGPSPIVSDQPEDAVPTTAVFETLVPTVRVQRAIRQFIVASHDANIVVAGDVENVIVLGGPGQEALSGTLFSPTIRTKAMELLEGGPTAFRLRQKRYGT